LPSSFLADAIRYVVGAVTRIKLKNFMTYDFVEFRPGPRLNMILGPNGTGKSSIAAAIAIGLGFSPNVSCFYLYPAHHPQIMGRAPNLQAYVKQGTEHAETEIELKAPRGKSNYVITRKFQMGNEKSTWQLNGKSKTKKDIEQLVTKLGVQANNLWCVFPHSA
jgi:chromosome segregation ATPase